MNKYYLLSTTLFFIIGCSNDSDNANQQPENAKIFKEQTEAIEKAKGVEAILQQGVIRNQKIIAEQSK